MTHLPPTLPPGLPTSIAETPAAPAVAVESSSVTFSAYPFAPFLQTREDAASGIQFQALDRTAYENSLSGLVLADRTYRTVILENQFLRLTFLPDLGGRLFQITYKPTNQQLLYNNDVLKPTHWGPAGQGGWLAAGGIEWALPVNEHGYEWGVPWTVTVTRDASGATATIEDTRAARLRARIQVTLPAHAAYIIIRPRLENPTAAPVQVQFWLNAALSVGATGQLPPQVEFTIPTGSVLIHSTGDSFIPASAIPADGSRAAAPLPWPLVAGRNLALYSNWDDYLGFFAADLAKPYVGVYNHAAELGLVRVFPPDRAPGVKLFGFGPRYCCRDEFADDGSDYVELWGGLPRTFFPADDLTLSAGEAREWEEYWLPFAGTGGLSAAGRDAVLYVSEVDGAARVAVYSGASRRGSLVLLQNEAEIHRWNVQLEPGVPFSASVPLSATGALQLRLLASDGSLVVASQ